MIGGANLFGENRVQEAKNKFIEIKQGPYDPENDKERF